MKSRLIAAALCFCSLTPLGALASDSAAAPLTTIAALDVPRYMGTWHEIARFPTWFQKKCTGESGAEYTLLADAQVQVINRCRLENGTMNEAIGSARQVGGAESSKLEVRFAPAWLSFLPFVWGNYWVIDLDDAYQLVAVSEPTREYLWILSRTKQVDQKAYDALLERLARKGFDLNKLQLTRQNG